VIERLCIVCAHVFTGERPVSLIVHHSDGAWQLVCGARDHPADCSDFETVGIEHLIDRQPNLSELPELKTGWLAEWQTGGWQTMVHDD